MKVLALDPGYDRLGIAVLEKIDGKETLCHSECFLTDKKDLYEDRLLSIGNRIEEVIQTHSPSVCASESLFFAKNQKTAIDVAGSRGVILYIARKHNLKVFEYKPNEIKLAVTGYGGSDKHHVTDMVKRLVTITKKDMIDDEYDAIAVGLTCLAIEK